MKRTTLYEVHVASGARMTDFAGFAMPVYYSSITEEHQAVRQRAGMFDVSHMGEFIVRGPKALMLLERITTNNVSRLAIGDVQYTCMTNEHGGVIDDLLLYRLQEYSYMMVVNAANIEKDWAWITAHNEEGAELINISDQAGLLAVQGPLALPILQPLTQTDLSQIAYYKFVRTVFGGVRNVLVSRTGYTGAGGFEIYFENIHAESLWKQIMQSGQAIGLLPAGLGARDTLRQEVCYRLYGNDIDETTTPLEAGLSWLIYWDKEFIGRNALMAQKREGLTRKLVGFVMLEKGIPRTGYDIVDEQEQRIGKVTSGCHSPTLQQGIGMAYVSTDIAQEGRQVNVLIRGQKVAARISRMPFLQPKT
ncbi:MAG: glycine cleavage system aminomethyltransferase GcvT [Chitinophagales bacterium]|nr:glycine cleavage system aminomethyltransferase GcvT [Chitinophagales bacterium]MDW8428830.1 glycine cleavage system aminomethyltransferase GcvT [Chitinophagales bacterium]